MKILTEAYREKLRLKKLGDLNPMRRLDVKLKNVLSNKGKHSKLRITIEKVCLRCKHTFLQEIIKDGSTFIKQFCSRKCANSKIQTSSMNKSRSLKLQGKSHPKRKAPLIKKICPCGNEFEVYPSGTKKYCSLSCSSFKHDISIRQSLHYVGGRCKWYNVDGQKVQGTWERDLAIHMSELGISWRKLKVGGDIIRYKKNSNVVESSYTPDFELPAFNKLIELKGYWWGDDKEKMKKVFEANPKLVGRLFIVEKLLYEKLLKTSSIEEFTNVLYEPQDNSFIGSIPIPASMLSW